MEGRVASTSRIWGERGPTPIADGIRERFCASWVMTRPASPSLCFRGRAAALNLRAGAGRHIDIGLRIVCGLGLATAAVHALDGAIILARGVDAITFLRLVGRRRGYWRRGLGEDRQQGHCRRSSDKGGFRHVHEKAS